MNSIRYREVPLFHSLYLPVALLLIFFLVRYIEPEFYRKWIESEQGVLEWGVPLILLPGIYYGIKAGRLSKGLVEVKTRFWFILVTLGSIYFAGEELSWGQHLFFWETPETIGAINDQNETNLHNMSSWFDQKPRIALELWALIGGIFMPVYYCLRKEELRPENWQYWFWPTFVCLPVAVIAIMIKIPERIKDIFGLPPYAFEVRWSEVQEFYFAIFLSLYLVSVYRRLDLIKDTRE